MKGRRTELGSADCAIARSLQAIGDWWSLMIVREAFRGRQRFGEFQKSLGLAKNILSSRLKKLVEEGVLNVEPDGATSSRNRYVLSAKGERLHVVLIALWQWGEDACFEPGELTQALVDNKQGAPLARLEPKSRDGRPIGSRDFHLADVQAESRFRRTGGRRGSVRPNADGQPELTPK